MTFAMDLIVQVNKHTPFKTIKVNYTARGIEGELVDARDGQVYKIEIIPTGVTLCPEAIDDAVNWKEALCES